MPCVWPISTNSVAFHAATHTEYESPPYHYPTVENGSRWSLSVVWLLSHDCRPHPSTWILWSVLRKKRTLSVNRETRQWQGGQGTQSSPKRETFPGDEGTGQRQPGDKLMGVCSNLFHLIGLFDSSHYPRSLPALFLLGPSLQGLRVGGRVAGVGVGYDVHILS